MELAILSIDDFFVGSCLAEAGTNISRIYITHPDQMTKAQEFCERFGLKIRITMAASIESRPRLI